jgi:hypothetical protein
MPTLSKKALLDKVMSAIASAGWATDTANPNQHPLEVTINNDTDSEKRFCRIIVT